MSIITQCSFNHCFASSPQVRQGRAWPFPDGDDLPETVKPAVLLPHDPPDPPIVFVDFDDVRDPATDEISNEVMIWRHAPDCIE